MRSPADLHDYQRKAILHQLFCPDSMLTLRPGLGKTVVTLTTLAHRMSMHQIKKTLVLGPVRVVKSVWKREALRWTHLPHLRFTVLAGTAAERARRLHGNGYDVALMSYDNLNWLAKELKTRYLDHGHPIPFQMVVYDEVSRMKNSTTVRVTGKSTERPVKLTPKGKACGVDVQAFLTGGWTVEQMVEHGYAKLGKAIKKVGWRDFLNLFQYRTGLTGTPAANGYIDLHGQYLVVDGGQRLGTHVTHFRDAYFQSDYMGWNYTPTELGKAAIERKIADITICMDAEDHIKMPALQVKESWVDLSPTVMAKYREVEKEMFTRLDCGTEIEVFNQASVSNKCLQFANGSAYVEPGKPEWVHVHDEKLEALDSLIEEHAGNPILLGYSFKFDAQRIMERYKKLHPVNITDLKTEKQLDSFLNRWATGRVNLAIGHPASCGHGIDGLQDSGGTLVWFGLPWSLELYDQMICRLYRQGGRQKVIVYRILARDTLDLAVMDALQRKDDTQAGLKKAINRYRLGMIASD